MTRILTLLALMMLAVPALADDIKYYNCNHDGQECKLTEIFHPGHMSKEYKSYLEKYGTTKDIIVKRNEIWVNPDIISSIVHEENGRCTYQAMDIVCPEHINAKTGKVK